MAAVPLPGPKVWFCAWGGGVSMGLSAGGSNLTVPSPPAAPSGAHMAEFTSLSYTALKLLFRRWKPNNQPHLCLIGSCCNTSDFRSVPFHLKDHLPPTFCLSVIHQPRRSCPPQHFLTEHNTFAFGLQSLQTPSRDIRSCPLNPDGKAESSTVFRGQVTDSWPLSNTMCKI